MRPKVLAAVRTFDACARPEAGGIRLSDGTTLPNERRALEWVVATFQARTPRKQAMADPQLAMALLQLERGLGPVQVVHVQPNQKGAADG